MQAKMSLKHAIALRRTMHGTTSFEADMSQSGNAQPLDNASSPAEELTSNEHNEGLDESHSPIDTISKFGGEEFHR